MTKYWIAVASEEHVKYGVAGGFVQAGHGKRSGIARMHAGDGIVYYSPKVEYGGDDALKAFTALTAALPSSRVSFPQNIPATGTTHRT